mmetsp:Transcript_7178/g.6268  ORF Transcript_7178/g.6268 Transcript_7178/m.6268 type:complete len:132 (+) Transcript_7178:1724-2119(+)|eukprot:CAMPEP_0170558302 /NCGR_PEP_ID=MMETSP0211-20121228/34298_1 /TAXON_ID=311385 /ORGANISM="Pseudokeronopsis sp., Strain OXSARD2" /LENGTH=131 /DNA_ID=CAMNT_0010870119 /DNA_START=1655 /DNA_END=2050 /DNA_ORIENTATION=-
MRGYLIRKRYLQLKKVYDFFKKVERKVLVREVAEGIKEAFFNVKNIKSQMLRNYVNHCATSIQKLYRGFYTRKYLIRIRKAFLTLEDVMVALVLGWRIRKIMQTKEIENIIFQMKDYSKAIKEVEREHGDP